jgi:putative spermidine/putrescine transport system permease protein
VGLLLAYAIVTSRNSALRQIVTAAAAVLANFGGVPLAFLFLATVGFPAGALTVLLGGVHISLQNDLHFQLTSVKGIGLVYLYFLIPLMVLVMTPALEGLKPQWAEAAENLGANRWHYWRHIAGPVLLPSFLGSVLLLFCSAFSAYATAFALVGSSFPLIPTQIESVLAGNVLSGQENLGAALALDMVVIVLPLTIIYQLLQRRTSKWLA